jgi:hypothetical protein
VSNRTPHVQEGELVELDWGGCLLTDRGSVDEIQALIGGEASVRGRRGIVEAIWLVEGRTPWPGPPWPRPVYRARWRPTDG